MERYGIKGYNILLSDRSYKNPGGWDRINKIEVIYSYIEVAQQGRI